MISFTKKKKERFALKYFINLSLYSHSVDYFLMNAGHDMREYIFKLMYMFVCKMMHFIRELYKLMESLFLKEDSLWHFKNPCCIL